MKKISYDTSNNETVTSELTEAEAKEIQRLNSENDAILATIPSAEDTVNARIELSILNTLIELGVI